MVYLVPAVTTFATLSWRQQPPKFRPLPPHIERVMVPSSGGELELLICESKAQSQSSLSSSSSSASSPSPPIFFIHGGFGSAGVWLEWMTYIHECAYEGTLYAYSARNHGASHALPFWKMVWATSFADIQADAVTCLEYAAARESKTNSFSRSPVLVGHSSGGGVAQALLASGKVQTPGLALIDAIPSFGSIDVYWNWLKHDPWFPVRNSFHLQHPASPLSTDELVRSAFFSRRFPLGLAAEFRRWMPGFEAMGWPLDMMGDDILEWIAGKGNKWLDCGDIVRGIDQGSEDGHGQGTGNGDDVCVLVGREDVMYRAYMWERQVAEYQAALRRTGRREDGEEKVEHGPAIERVDVESGDGVRLILVADSGHHVQNDLWRDQAAEALLRWIRQV